MVSHHDDSSDLTAALTELTPTNGAVIQISLSFWILLFDFRLHPIGLFRKLNICLKFLEISLLSGYEREIIKSEEVVMNFYGFLIF